ncbi:hypothetical protein [Ruegeria haliotis]|nr:hypothetical protein [Ruegeria haliotis]
MESPAREFDESRLDAAIADILGEDKPVEQKAETPSRPEFPDLSPQEEVTARIGPKDAGLSAVLRQKWAELSGAA